MMNTSEPLTYEEYTKERERLEFWNSLWYSVIIGLIVFTMLFALFLLNSSAPVWFFLMGVTSFATIVSNQLETNTREEIHELDTNYWSK